jgi:hypothetical protein
MKPSAFPFIPEELFKALEAAFPNALPWDANMPHPEMCALIGQQQVLAFLRAKRDQQQRPERSF